MGAKCRGSATSNPPASLPHRGIREKPQWFFARSPVFETTWPFATALTLPSMKIAAITQLGEARYDSPIPTSGAAEENVPSAAVWPDGKPPDDLLLFEKAGPRQKLYFEPQNTRAAIVTCGGLCPGLNNVIRSVTRELVRRYGVKSILG